MDSKPKKYELEKDKIKTLKRQLAKVLMRANVKFSFTTVFIGTLILIYSKNFADAHAHRKEQQEMNPSPDLKPKLRVVKKPTEVVAEEVEIEPEIDDFEEQPIDEVAAEELADNTPKSEPATFRVDATTLGEQPQEEPKPIKQASEPEVLEPAPQQDDVVSLKPTDRPRLRKGESMKINTTNL